MSKRARRGTSVQKTLQSIATPVFVVNDRRAVTFFNSGCEELTGWSAADLLGQTCDYTGDSNPASTASLTSTLCPPPEAFLGEPTSVPAYVLHRDGRSTPRLVHYFPLSDAEGAVVAVLGVIAPLPPPRSAPEATPAQLLHAELAAQRAFLRMRYGLKSVVARTPEMLRAMQQVQLARGGMSPAVLCGERGAGKEHLARVIHTESETRARSFVPLDCRTLPEFELRQTLRRLFSLDPEDRRSDAGTPQSLQPGTLFLQHVESLPRDLQEFVAKELAGDSPQRPVRILAGTSTRLEDAVANETFRSDLYFRLTALRVEIPPLRARVEEIALLAQAFLEELNRGAETQRGGFSEEVLRQFREYRWPGNLDELAAVVAEARDASAGPTVQAQDLPFRFRTGRDAQAMGTASLARATPLDAYLEQIEKAEIERALEQVKYNRTRAADLLGMPRPKLYRRMEALGISDGEGHGADGGDHE